MKISAVIFDLDGTVLDNEDEYGLAFKKVLQSLGAEVKSYYPHRGGIGVKENWPGLLRKYHIKTKKAVNELVSATQQEYLRLLSKVKIKKGLQVFVRELKESGIKTALATSNDWYVLKKVFDTLLIEKFFDSVTTGNEVENKKPAPDLFLTAADKLDVKPKECLIIEDSASGVEAARRAGMKVIAIARDTTHAKELKDADMVIKSYNQLSPETIAGV